MRLLEVLLVRNAWESERTYNRIATRWIETPLAPWRVPAGRAPESLRRACGDADPFLLAGYEVHPDIRYDDWMTDEIGAGSAP